MADGLGPLNLADADIEGFAPLDAGRYDAEVFEIKMDATKNEGKMPIGTPMIKIQFKLTGEGVENRRVFTQFVVPPNNYDKKKAATMKGMIARFFMALGDTEETVRSKNFNPDFQDYLGRPCVVTLSKEEYPAGSGEFQNRVKGIKAAGTLTGNTSGLL